MAEGTRRRRADAARRAVESDSAAGRGRRPDSESETARRHSADDIDSDESGTISFRQLPTARKTPAFDLDKLQDLIPQGQAAMASQFDAVNRQVADVKADGKVRFERLESK